jgi:DNA-binding transcriptional LysR family regulator
MDRYRVFRAVAEEGSFSRAAARVHRTQSAVSQAVRALEDETGERLFERAARSVRLTHAGELLLSHVRVALEALDAGLARLSGLQELREGTLALSASDTTAMYTLPEVLRVFRERYPGVELQISNDPSPRAVRKVLAAQADLALVTLPVVTLPVEHARLEVAPLGAREDVVICARSHPLAATSRARLRDLARHRWLLLDRAAHTRRFIDAQFRRAGLRPRIAMETASLEVIKRLVELDLGISVAPRLAIQEELRAGRLHAVEVFARRDVRRLGVVTLRGRAPSPAAARFIELLRERPSLLDLA